MLNNKKKLNLSNFLNKITKLEIKIIFFLITVYYYLIPLLILFIGQKLNFFVPQSLENSNYDQIVLTQNFLILISFNFLLFLSIFVFVGKNIYFSTEYNLKNKDELNCFNLIIVLVVILISAFIIYDILKLVLFFFEYLEKNNDLFNVNDFDTFFKNFRDEVKSLIFQRRTHYKILIILSVYLYRYNMRLSIVTYLLLIIVNLFALSRFEIIQLLILHFLFNIKFQNIKLKNFFITIIFLSILIFYRYFIFLFDTPNVLVYLNNFLGDGVSTFATNFIFLENIKELFANYKSYDLFFLYFKNTFLYFMNDFFYFNYEILDFFSHSKFPNYTFSNSPPLEFILYLPLLLIYLCVFFLIRKYKLINNIMMYNIILLTLLLFSFRGSWIHEFGFLIKLFIIMKIIEIVSKNKIVLGYAKKIYKRNI